MVIALFYTPGIETVFLTLAAATTAILVLMNLLSCRFMGLYIFVGLFLWYFMLKSGVHATLAGVILGLMIFTRCLTTTFFSKKISKISKISL